MVATREQWPAWTGKVRIVSRDARGRFTGTQATHNLIVNAGLNLLRDALHGTVTDAQIKYLAVGRGVGTLTTGLTNGQTGITSLAVTALNQALAANASITLVSGTTTQVVTVTAAGAASGATSIPTVSFTASAAFPVGTAVIITPTASDTQLTSEQFRKAVTQQSNGGSPGQLVTTVYLAPQDCTTFTIGVLGWFAGASAGVGANSGVLVAVLPYQRAKTASESVNVARTDTI